MYLAITPVLPTISCYSTGHILSVNFTIQCLLHCAMKLAGTGFPTLKGYYLAEFTVIPNPHYPIDWMALLVTLYPMIVSTKCKSAPDWHALDVSSSTVATTLTIPI